MSRIWLAVMAAVCVLPAGVRAGDIVLDPPVTPKPTVFASCPTCAPTHAKAAPAACCGKRERHCWEKLCNYFSYCPETTCPSCCMTCGSCGPPLYLYFLHDCYEGGACQTCAAEAKVVAPPKACATRQTCGTKRPMREFFHTRETKTCETCGTPQTVIMPLTTGTPMTAGH
jgi:hypothetical protein